MTSSGTYDWQLTNADIILEAFDRCEIRPPAITGAQMISVARSLNLELQRWSNAGVVNLWEVDLLTQNLTQGISTYTLPQETECLLDCYIRQFSLGGVFNATPSFSTVTGQRSVRVTISNNAMDVGSWINIATPIAVGGIVLQGYYQAVTVIDTNNFTITAANPAVSTVSNGGVVPLFNAVQGQIAINVTLDNHGYVAGETFNVYASTSVGGIILSGPYTVSGVTDVNNFGISITQNVAFNDQQYENYGYAQIQFQQQGSAYTDFVMTPFGRTDYAQIPNKLAQARPTVYWFNRQITPQITLWQVPDGGGPYQLCMYRMKRVQDAAASMGQTPDIPYRAYDALCGQLSLRVAMKYAKSMLPSLQPDAERSWNEFHVEDRERAEITILPDFSGYYRI